MVKILGVECNATGYGMMGLHMPPTPQPPEAALPILKHAFDNGCRFWSAAIFYGSPDYNSLHVIHDYFRAYPEDTDKVIISVKIGFNRANMEVEGSAAQMRAGYEECERILKGVKKIDILASSRVDPKVSVEETVGELRKLVDEGKIGGAGMSECGAETLKKAAKVCPIVAVEVEFSLFTPDILTNGVLEAAGEVGAVIAAYSPIGRGLLTGKTMKMDDVAENDPRRMHPRFQKDALENNAKLTKELGVIADRLGVSRAQVALAWVRTNSGRNGGGEILPIPGSVKVERIDENAKEVKLTDEDMNDIGQILKRNPVIGARYPAAIDHLSWG